MIVPAVGHYNVMVIGKGAREHAISWKLNQSQMIDKIYTVPGNAGTARGMTKVSNCGPDIDDSLESPQNTNTTDMRLLQRDVMFRALISAAEDHKVSLVLSIPDNTIEEVVAQVFEGTGIPCFGPTKEAIVLESSRTVAKSFMEKYNVPTAQWKSHHHLSSATRHVDEYYTAADGKRAVIKRDRKGSMREGKSPYDSITFPKSAVAATSDLEGIYLHGKFGQQGREIIIEEYVDGIELSILTFTDKKTWFSLPPVKPCRQPTQCSDEGPLTRGARSHVPVSEVTSEDIRKIEDTVIRPTFEGLTAEGWNFCGILCTTLILTPMGPKVLEYNVRVGDPDTQALMMYLSDETDLGEIIIACTQGRLGEVKQKITYRDGFISAMVLIRKGFPGPYKQGEQLILRPSTPKGVQVFHHSTTWGVDNSLVTTGGRILTVTSHEKSLSEAYEACEKFLQTVELRTNLSWDNTTSNTSSNSLRIITPESTVRSSFSPTGT